MTTTSAARRAAEEDKVATILDAVRRPESRAGKLTPVPSEQHDVSAAPAGAAGEGSETPGAATTAAPEIARAPESVVRDRGTAAPTRPSAGRQTETVIRTPATIDDVFTQLEAPWELRDKQVLVRSYSMDAMTTDMLRELQEWYGVDMSTVVRQAVKALYVEGKRRRGRR